MFEDPCGSALGKKTSFNNLQHTRIVHRRPVTISTTYQRLMRLIIRAAISSVHQMTYQPFLDLLMWHQLLQHHIRPVMQPEPDSSARPVPKPMSEGGVKHNLISVSVFRPLHCIEFFFFRRIERIRPQIVALHENTTDRQRDGN